MKISVIIPAAGTGTRLSADKPKQYLEIDNIPIVVRTIKLFDNIEEVDSIVIPVHAEWVSYTKDIVKQFNCDKVKEVTIGGIDRQASVSVAIHRPAIKDSELVLIHDAVRPFASEALIRKLIETADECGAAVPVLRPKDTLKEVSNKGYITKTLNRDSIVQVQTPQAYWTSIALEAYDKAAQSNFSGTDTASLVEFIGCKVAFVEGEEANLKITTRLDLDLSYAISKLTSR